MILQNMKLLDISQSWNLKAITIYKNHFFLYGDFYCLYISNINNNNNNNNIYLLMFCCYYKQLFLAFAYCMTKTKLNHYSLNASTVTVH